MHQRKLISRGLLAAAVVALTAYGCDRQNPYKLGGDATNLDDCPAVQGDGGGGSDSGVGPSSSSGQGASTPGLSELDDRVLDYNEALRTASLKLVGNLPPLEQVYELADSSETDKPAKYEEMVDAMFADPRFSRRMIEYYRTVFKAYGPGTKPEHPTRETAATFAARIIVEARPWTDLVTASSNTCPSYDEGTDTFVDGECSNNITPVGVLTDPGLQSLYFGNLAFRRNRFYHELLLCRNGNASGGAEPSANPSKEGACGETAPSNYTSPWSMNSIAGECNGGRVDFHEYGATITCANCHATWNHRAPLFGKFDSNGMYDPDNYMVLVPVAGAPNAELSDWLPPGEPTAWKNGTPVSSLAEMGQAIAADDEALHCAVKRMWNYGMSRGDIVDHESPVPNKVVADLVEDFKANNYNMKAVLRNILLHDDFVRF